MFMRSFSAPSRWLCLFAIGLFALAGCEKDEIHSYTVARPAPETLDANVRLLAAIFENGQEQWFFKIAGSVDEVTRYAPAFLTFVESVRFTGKQNDPVEWSVPAGWEKGPASGLRYATFSLGPKGKAPELTVFRFTEISPLLENVNRWCRLDLGRRPLREAQLPQYTKTFHAGNNKGILVDMTGPGPRGKGHPPMAAAGGMPKPGPLPIEYTTPEGWEETGPQVRRGIRLFTTFVIKEGEERANAEVTNMRIGGGVLLNVNRWRDQVGLREITKAQLDRAPSKTIKVAGRECPYYDFTGSARRLLVVSVERGDKSWFFKLIGPAGLVGKNKSRFESFVQSVKFTTGAGDE
jgi:hypothetical protein